MQPLLGLDGDGVGADAAADVGAGVTTMGAGVGADVTSGSGSGSSSGCGIPVGAGVAAGGVGDGVDTGPMLPLASLKSAQFRKASGYESCELPVINSHCKVQGSSCVQVSPAGK